MAIKNKIIAFMENLILYDYILFGAVFVLFVLFLVLAIILREKIGLSIFLIFISFCILILGPTLGYIKMHQYLFKNTTKLISQKKLSFTPAIVVKGTITNESKFDFSSCKITASVFKSSRNIIKKHIYPLKPLKNMSIIKETILKGETQEFKIIVEPFRYTKDYNISLKASCK